MKNTGPTTVLQLASLAGGIGFEGDRKDAHIVRTNGNSKYIVDINVQKILEGKQADVALQPEDILFIPTNSMRAAIKGGGSGLIVSLASAYLYTHP
jgi:polysaccharide export outer membrane protein